MKIIAVRDYLDQVGKILKELPISKIENIIELIYNAYLNDRCYFSLGKRRKCSYGISLCL